MLSIWDNRMRVLLILNIQVIRRRTFPALAVVESFSSKTLLTEFSVEFFRLLLS